jgi:dephospho-CoA kinase
VAAWLVGHGCRYLSLSDELRADLHKRGLEPTRDNLIVGGRRLRAEGGPGVLARLVLERIAQERGENAQRAEPITAYAVDSVRTPGEVALLRGAEGFVLLEVVAAIDARYARVMDRGRLGDAADFAEFVRQEKAELDSKDAAAQQLNATASLADLRVHNDGTPADLDAALAALFPHLSAQSASTAASSMT